MYFCILNPPFPALLMLVSSFQVPVVAALCRPCKWHASLYRIANVMLFTLYYSCMSVYIYICMHVLAWLMHVLMLI